MPERTHKRPRKTRQRASTARERRVSRRPGRPAWEPSKADLKKAEKLAAHGLTMCEIGLCMGVSETTMYKKSREFAQFERAIKRGRAQGIRHVCNALYEAASKGNVTAMIFYLKARAGWRERQEVELSGPSREPLVHVYVPLNRRDRDLIKPNSEPPPADDELRNN